MVLPLSFGSGDSPAAPLPMSDLGLVINNRPDLPALVARWQREVTPDELQAGYQAILAAADDWHCSRWLLDLRRRNDVGNPAVTAWVTGTFLPQLNGRYSHPVRIAFLVSPSRATSLAPPPAPSFDPAADHQSATFIEEAAAYQWLNEGPPLS